MKKRLFALLVASLMLVSVLALTSCDVMSMLPDSITSLIPGLGGDSCADGHVDANGDEVCDNCDAAVPKQDTPTLPEEPEREPTYKISFNFHGVVYDDKKDNDGGIELDTTTGKPVRIGVEKDVELYVLDVLQNQAPTKEQLDEIPGITYGGITILGWYDTPELENEVDFKEVLTADKKVYAKLRINEPDKKGNNYCGDDATWEVTSRGKLIIDGEGPMYDFTYPELVPWYFNEDGTRRQISAIEIGEDITHIGSYSFYGLGISQAKDIEMGESVTSIGSYAFAYSTNLKDAPLTDTIETISHSAFRGCKSFTSIIIPNSVSIIDGYAFAECTEFEYIIIGTGVTNIGEYAFNQTLGNTVSAKHKNIFYLGTAEQYDTVVVQLGNPNFNSYGSYLYFYVEADSEEAKTAGQYWSYDAKGNPKPLSYTLRYYVDGNAFPLLTDFVLIGEDKTGSFTQANVDAMNDIVYRGFKFAGWSGNIDKYISGVNKVTQNLDFKGSRGDLVGDKATYHYDAVTYTLTIKGEGATWNFEGAGDTVYFDKMIKKVVFEEGITSLGANLLAGITTLIDIEIPDTITSIDPKAFSGCTNLASIYYLGTDLSKCEGIESLVEMNANVYAKGTEESTGAEGAFWQDKADGARLAWSYKNGILTIGGANEMPDFEKGEAPWLGYEGVKELVFASNIVKLGENSFNGMKGIEKLTLHSKLVNIPRSAFEGSGYWNNEANWQIGALMAGEHLLAFDASKIPEGVAYATIPQATKIIIANAFKGCESVKELVLPVVINSIDATAFAGLSGLERIYYYGQNVNAWNDLPDAVDAFVTGGVKVLYRATQVKCLVCKAEGPLPCDKCGEKVNPECEKCQGNGNFVACSDCGTEDGSVNPECEECAGKGVLAACDSCGKTINKECDGCEGEGVECETCGGSGIRPDAADFWRMVSRIPTTWDK